MQRIYNTICFVALALAAGVTQADDGIVWFDLSDYDDAQASSGGQLFTDVCDDVDMTIETERSSLSSWVHNDVDLMAGDLRWEMTCFTVAFTDAVEIVLELQSLDASETVSLTSANGVSYTHGLGATPTIATSTGTMIKLTGNGYAFDDETGAARGLFTLGPTTSFTWCHRSLDELGYEGLSIGKAVPEPAAMSLLWLACGGLAVRRRKA